MNSHHYALLSVTMQCHQNIIQTLVSNKRLSRLLRTAPLRLWTCAREPGAVNAVDFAVDPPVSRSLWCAAYTWARTNKPLLALKEGPAEWTFVSAQGRPPITERTVNKYIRTVEKREASSFQQYKEEQLGIWKFRLLSAENPLNGQCTCPPFLKEYVCKHVLGLAIRKKLVQVPANIKNVPLGAKPKRDRLKKAAKALVRD